MISHHPSFWRSLRRAVTLVGMMALGVVLTLLTQRLLAPARTQAQASPGAVQGPRTAAPPCSLAAQAQPRDCVTVLKARADATYGNILTDAGDNTLYYFDDPTSAAAQDPLSCAEGPALGRSNPGEVKTCLAAWPALVTADVPVTSADVTGRVGVIRRPDFQNVPQVTYNGAPLYYFFGDPPGAVNGQGNTAFGAHWQVVTVP